MRWLTTTAARVIAQHAASSTYYRPLYERTKQRLGRNRGSKVARITVARKLAESIWQTLTRNQPFAPAGAAESLAG